jgi:hypothetical protein
MFGKTLLRKSVTLTTLVAVWCVYSMVAFAAPVDTAAEITVTGQVMVNGQPAVSNATVLSGAVISTAANSSATISLGRNGRVEVDQNTSVTLNFGPSNIIVMVDSPRTVDSSKVRVSSAPGVSTTATTKNATFIADSGQADNFALEVECSHTHVDTATGSVNMREGASDHAVVAGATAVAGNLDQPGCKPCLRPNSTPPPSYTGHMWWLALVAVAAGVGIFLASRNNNDFNFGGSPVVISPSK